MARTAAACVCLACLVASPARAGEPTREELLEQLRQLQARVEHLEAAHARSTPDARDVDRVVSEVLADAERRSRLMMQDGSVTGGFDLERGKFFLRSADGNFLLIPGFLFQARHVTNFNEGDDDASAPGADDGDEVENGFEIRRMRMIFTGNVFSPDWVYRFQFESNLDGGGVFLQDAFVRHAFADNWAWQVGQFYDVVFHEQSMLDPFLLAADRSLVNALIGGGQTERVQGAMLIYDDDDGPWRAQLVLHDGYNSDNTDFTEDGGGGTAFTGVAPTDYGASARVEYFLRGTRRAYEDFTSFTTRQKGEPLVVVGAGASYSQGDGGDVLFHTLDLQVEDTPVAAYAALYGLWREIDDDSPVPEGSHYDWGFLVQGSVPIRGALEGFVRYDLTMLDDGALAAGAEDDVHELTVGANYYFQNHNLKFTLDLTWLPNGTPVGFTGLGVVPGDDDQFVLRAQLQLFI